jgi:pSer/pThr/pTyr-binding forkhead associated (FHA) protein
MSEAASRRFWEACGASGPLVLEVDSDGVKTRTWSFPRPFAIVGNDVRAHIPLLDPRVSRRHTYLQIIAGRAFCVDLGSRTGTQWDQAPRRSRWLPGGCPVGVGPYTLRFRGSDPLPWCRTEGPADLPDPLQTPVPDQDDLPRFLLQAQNLKSQPSWQLNRVLTLLGRSPECQITLAEQSVSPFHCSLFCTGGGVWVVDLLGHRRIDVNGKKMRWAHLHDGDELRVGRVLFRVRYGSSSGAGDGPASGEFTAALGPGSTVQSTQSQVEPWGVTMDTTADTCLPRALEPGPLVPGRIAEALLRMLTQQLDSLLEESRDQLQRTMAETAKALVAMHQERMALVRLESEQIRRLADQVKALRKGAPQLASRSPATAQVAGLDREAGCEEPARTPDQPCPNPRSNASSSRMCEA